MTTATKSGAAKRADGRVDAVRAFNRFYTKEIGLLGSGYLGTPYTLAETRVIWELAQRPSTEVTELRRDLDLDPGYLSRILARFERDGLVARERSPQDRRRQLASLTRRGRATFRSFDRRSSAEIGELLDDHTEEEQRRLAEAMGSVRAILGDPAAPREVTLRAPEPGDHGWVLERHGSLYAAERGWGEPFQALVAKVVHDFLAGHDPERERMWVADLDGERAGSVYCTRRSPRVAQLRLLLVEPWARGSGAGSKLVDACLDFARAAGYRQMMLWTNSSLTSARRIYDARGFELRSEAPSEVFDADSVGQELWLDL